MQEQYTTTGVIYARYSSHSQRDVSIEQQLKACENFAKLQGIQIVGIYNDRALTGTSDNRPGFQKMIADAKRNNWNYVIVYTLDRFTRDRYDSAVYKRQLKNHGVKVLSAMENISDDPTGVLMESVLEGLAEYYSKELSRKIRRGMEDNASKCMVNGSLPLGYMRSTDGKYAIKEDEAVIVQEIFRRVISKEPFTEIIEDLNRRKIFTKTGKIWNKSSFNSILSNERYKGVYIYGNTRIPGGIPAIISENTFNEAQVLLTVKKNPRSADTTQAPQRRRRENGVYLLTGKLFCGHCKSPMVGISGTSKQEKLHYYYTCKGRRSGAIDCKKKNVRREYIEEYVAAALKDTILTNEGIRLLADAAIAYQNESAVNHELTSLKQQRNEAEKSLKNLMAAIEAGIFSATTQTRLIELETTLRDLDRMIAVAQAQADEQLTREEIIAALELFQVGDVTDKSYQEALIDTFLVAAYVYDDCMDFIFNLNGKKKTSTLPFSIEDLDLPDLTNVRIDSSLVHQ